MAEVTVYDAKGNAVSLPTNEAVHAIKIGTHKAEGRKKGDVPKEWLEELKPKRLVKANINKVKDKEVEVEERGEN
jgi:hypothetical protein